MTDDPTLDALDRRGRAAATGLRTAVLDRPVPVFEPDVVRIDIEARPARTDHGTGADRRRPAVSLLVAAAAVLVVVAAIAVLAVTGSDADDDGPADRIAPEDVRRFVLGDVPRGFDIAHVHDLGDPSIPLPSEILNPGPMTVYGPDPDRPSVGVFVFPDPGPGNDLPSEVSGEPRIDGSVGPRMWDISANAGEDSVAVEVGDRFVGLLGVGSWPRDLAARVEVRGDAAGIPAADLPEGWSDLGRAAAYDGYPGTYGLEPYESRPVWVAQYTRRFGTDRVEIIRVTATTGDPVRARVAALGADDTEIVEIRGHQALLAHYEGVDGLGGYSLTWEERNGEIVQIFALDTLGRAGMIGLAEDLAVVDADAVTGLREDALEAGTTDPGVTVLGRGTFSSGDEWLLAHGPAADEVAVRTTAVQLSAHGFDTGDGNGDERSLFGETVSYAVATEVTWAYGTVAEEVAEVQVRAPGGRVHPATIVEADGIRGWVAELPPSDDPEEAPASQVLALDAEGRTLDTATIGA
jgi:hypothetical protein